MRERTWDWAASRWPRLSRDADHRRRSSRRASDCLAAQQRGVLGPVVLRKVDVQVCGTSGLLNVLAEGSGSSGCGHVPEHELDGMVNRVPSHHGNDPGRSTRSRSGPRQWHQQPTQAVPSWHLHGRSHDPARQAVLRWPKGPMPRPPARPSLGPRLASTPPLRWRRTRSRDAPNRTPEGLSNRPASGGDRNTTVSLIESAIPTAGHEPAPGFGHAFGNGNIKEAIAVRCLGGD